MRKKIGFIVMAMVLLLCSCTKQAPEQKVDGTERQKLELGELKLSFELPKGAKEAHLEDEYKNYARSFFVPSSTGYRSVDFSYARYQAFANDRPQGLGILFHSEGTLLNMIQNNPSITGKELLNELHKTDSALLDIDIYYEQIAECKTVKFKSGLEGIAFMTVERNLSGGITPRIIFTYVLILDKGLLTISYWPIISSEEEFKAEMAKIGYTELTKLDAVAHKGKEQSINIYNAIKDQTITLNGAYSMYCDYIGLQDTLKVLAQ